MLKVSLGETFEPKYQVGAEPGKPYRVHIKYLTPEEREEVELNFYQARKTKVGLEMRVSIQSALRYGLVEMENYALEVDGKCVEIKSADDFFKYPQPFALFQEIGTKIKESSGIDEKN